MLSLRALFCGKMYRRDHVMGTMYLCGDHVVWGPCMMER